MTDARGNTTTYGYDALNRRNKVTNALNEVSHSKYDLSGNITQTEDALHNITNYNYDRLNRQLTINTVGLPDTTIINYDELGRIKKQKLKGISSVNDRITNYTYVRFGYTGRELDTETGLYYYRARYYDPSVGRFISEDPIGFGGGDTNLYRYVGNNSTNYTDPTGTTISGWADDLLNGVDSVVAGFANVVSFGITNKIRSTNKLAVENQQGFLYDLGTGLGLAATLALNPAGSGAAWAKGAASAYQNFGIAYGIADSTKNVLTGQGSAWDLLNLAPVAGFALHNHKAIGGAISKAGDAGADAVWRGIDRVLGHEQPQLVLANQRRAASATTRVDDVVSHQFMAMSDNHPGYGNIPEEHYGRYDSYLSQEKPKGHSDPEKWWEQAQRIWNNNLRGNDFEKKVRQAAGTPIGKGSKPVNINGRIPDLPVGEKFGVTDVKDWVEIQKTEQLTTFYEYAVKNDLPFNLIVSPKTQHIGEPILDMIRETKGKIQQFNPATEEFSEIAIGKSGLWKRK